MTPPIPLPPTPPTSCCSAEGRNKEQYHELALFAGAGLGLLGSKLLGHRIICYVENDPGCVAILKARIADGYLDDAPIWDDVTTFDGRPWAGRVDIISAGFPCQPYSSAGDKLGEDDERNLWPDTCRIIGETRPNIILLENVSTILDYEYFGTILAALSQIGYHVRWVTLEGQNVGSPQHRKRLWLMANANGIGTAKVQTEARELISTQSQATTKAQHWWARQPLLPVCGVIRRIPQFAIHGMVDGDPNWMDRIRAIGQGQVPAVVRLAWRILT